MKQKILLLICMVATLGLASCKKETIVQDTPNKTFTFVIQPNQWVPNGDKSDYSYQWKSNSIDKITLQDEGVIAYFSHPEDYDTDIALPSVYNGISYSYQVFNGGITFDIQTSDAQSVIVTPPTKPIHVKVLVLPSKYQGSN